MEIAGCARGGTTSNDEGLCSEDDVCGFTYASKVDVTVDCAERPLRTSNLRPSRIEM